MRVKKVGAGQVLRRTERLRKWRRVIGQVHRKSRQHSASSFVQQQQQQQQQHQRPDSSSSVQSGKQGSSSSLSPSQSFHSRGIGTTRTLVNSQWSPTFTRVRGPPCRSSAAASPSALLLLQLLTSSRVPSTRHSWPIVLLHQMASPDAADAASSPLRLSTPTDQTTTTPPTSTTWAVPSANALYPSPAAS